MKFMKKLIMPKPLNLLIKLPLGLILFSLFFLMSSCFKKNYQIDYDLIRDANQQYDIEALTSDVDACGKMILTLDNIIEIAIERNLNLWVQQYELEIQMEIETGEKLKMLPQLIASYEKSWRSKPVETTSQNTGNGFINTPGISTAQTIERWDFTLTWNLLDLGIAYLRSLQGQDKVFVSFFQYERAKQKLILDIARSYWRAITSMVYTEKANQLKDFVSRQQFLVQDVINSQDLSSLQGFRDINQLAAIKSYVDHHTNVYTNAKIELASYMGFISADMFELAPINTELVYEFPQEHPIHDLESLALHYRPELSMSDFEERAAIEQVRITQLQMFPSLSPYMGYNYNSDRFLINHYWWLFGARSAWNILGLFDRNNDQCIAKTRLEQTEVTRLALTINVLSQVNLAYSNYLDALEYLAAAQEIQSYTRELVTVSTNQVEQGLMSEFELIRYQYENLVAEIEVLNSLAELQFSLETLNNSIGLPLYFKPEDLYHFKLESNSDCTFPPIEEAA